MAFVWLLPAQKNALHSGAPVGLSLVDRGVVFQMQLHGAHVLDQPLRRAQRRTPVGLSLVDRGCFSDAYAAWRPLWP